jgi:hypothetical protein
LPTECAIIQRRDGPSSRIEWVAINAEGRGDWTGTRETRHFGQSAAVDKFD